MDNDRPTPEAGEFAAQSQDNIFTSISKGLRGIEIADTLPVSQDNMFSDFLHPKILRIAHECTTFHSFSSLPIELRLAIWELARPDPRIVHLKEKTKVIDHHIYFDAVYSNAPIPAILQTSSESRKFALENWYTLNSYFWFTANARADLLRNTLIFYFDPENDYAYVGTKEDHSTGFQLDSPASFHRWPRRVRLITRKIISNHAYSQGTRIPRIVLYMAKGFPWARELIFLNPMCPCSRVSRETLSVDMPNINDLAPSTYTFEWQHGLSLQDRYAFYATWITGVQSHMLPLYFGVEKISAMELAVTPRNTHIHGFMSGIFTDLDVRSLLQEPIPGAPRSEVKAKQSSSLRGVFVGGRRVRPQAGWEESIYTMVELWLGKIGAEEATMPLNVGVGDGEVRKQDT